MDPRTNPFAPGAGVPPAELAGREDVIEAFEIAFDRILGGLHANSAMLLGLRGVGKTVLLNRLHDSARARGFETVKFEVPDGRGGHFTRMLAPQLDVVLRRLNRRRAVEHTLARAGAALRNFASVFKVTFEGFEFGASESALDAASGHLESDLPELIALTAAAARERGVGLGLFIDEVQYLAKDELSALARAAHEAAQQQVPFLLLGAGLPQVAALAGDAKSYAERLFDYPQIGALDATAARRAVAEPAARMGAGFTAAALDRIVADTKAYPFFLQTWGKFAWDEAEGPEITEDDVIAATPAIHTYLDQNFFRVRFDRCTAFERQYLRAMAELGPGPHRTGDIAAAWGTNSAQVANIRRGLIRSGMIYSQHHGETAFTVPLFDIFMKRAMPALETYHGGRG